METKSFTLVSGNEEGAYWSIRSYILKNGTFSSKGSFHFREQSEQAEYMRGWKLNNKIAQREYYHLSRVKEPRLIYNRRYYSSHRKEFKEWDRKYRMTSDGRIAIRKARDKRRQLGYIEILPPIWGCAMHHVDDERVIPIPEVVHRKFIGISRSAHRDAIDNWMREIRPDLWLLVHLP